MVLVKAEVEITITTSAGKPPCSAAAYLASMRKGFPVSGVTFLKTLVSDYQILSPVQSFACTLVQQSSKYKPMTFSGRLLCRFCLIQAYRQRTSTSFDLSPGVVN
jgi:hypothetical protein